MRYKQIKLGLALFVGLAFSMPGLANNSIAKASSEGNVVHWLPSVNSVIVLEVSNGFQFAYRKVFTGSAPNFTSTHQGELLADGQYSYQLTATNTANGNGSFLRQSGSFKIMDGNIILYE